MFQTLVQNEGEDLKVKPKSFLVFKAEYFPGVSVTSNCLCVCVFFSRPRTVDDVAHQDEVVAVLR